MPLSWVGRSRLCPLTVILGRPRIQVHCDWQECTMRQFHLTLKSMSTYFCSSFIIISAFKIDNWHTFLRYRLCEMLANIELAAIFIVLLSNVLYFAVAMFQLALVWQHSIAVIFSPWINILSFFLSLDNICLYLGHGLHPSMFVSCYILSIRLLFLR